MRDERKTKIQLVRELRTLRTKLKKLEKSEEKGKRSKDALKESEERYRSLVEGSPDAVAIHHDGKFVFVNPAGAKLLGAQNPQELIGSPVLDVVHMESRSRVIERMRQVANGKKAPLDEEKFVKLDGTVIDVEVVGTPCSYQGQTATQVVVRDITERKKREEEQAYETRLHKFRSEMAYSINRHLSLGEILQQCAETITRNLDIACAHIWVMNRETHSLELQAHAELGTLSKESRRCIHNANLLAGRVVAEGHPIANNSILDGPSQIDRPWARHNNIAAYAGLPLLVENQIVGVLTVFASTLLLEPTLSPLAGSAVTLAQGIMRKKAEESVVLLAHTIRSTGECISITDTDNKILFVNDSFLRTYGYTADELIGKPIAVVRSSRSDPAVEKILSTTLESGWQGELVNRKKDGTEFLIALSTSVVRDEKGQSIALVGIAADITERKRAEEEWRESEERYRLLLENAGLGVAYWDVDGKLLFMNEKALGFMGGRASDYVGKSVRQLYGEHDGEVFMDRLRKAAGSEKSEEYEDRVSLPTGVRWFQSTYGAVCNVNHEIVGVQVISGDITERKRAEEALRTSANNLARAQQIGKLGCWDWDIAGNSLSWSDETYCIWGVGKEFSLTFDNIAGMIHPDDRESNSKMVQEFFGTRDEGHHEFRIICPDGTTKCIYQSIEVTRAPSGQPIRMFGIMHDITERKQAEEVLQRSEVRFRELFDHMSSGVAVYEAVDSGGDFIFRDFNPAAEKIEKVSKKDVLGKRVSECFPGVKAFGVFEVFQRVWRTGKPEYFPQNIYRDERDPGSWRESWVFRLPSGEIVDIYNDVTERKQAEATLKQALEWQKAIFEGSRDAVFISDQDSRFVAVNNAACDLTGYSRERLLKMRIPDVHDHPDLEAYKTYHHRIFGGEETLSEAKILRSDGAKVDAEFNNRCVSIAGKPYMHTTARDIAARKRAEEVLKESEERFRTFVESQGEGMGIVDAQECFEFVNPAAETIFGVARGGLKGRNLVDFVKPSQMAIIEAQTNVRRKGKRSTYELEIVRADGETRYLIVTATPRLHDERYIGAFGAFRDITERKRAEEELKKERALLSTIIETIPDEICLKDTDSRYIIANKASVAALGAKSLEEMIGKTDLEYVQRDLALRLLAEEKQILESGRPSIGREVVRLDPTTGQITKCDLYTKVPVKAQDGTTVGLLAINTDITQRKRAEENMKRSELRLRQLSAHLESVREEERKHIAQEFHDQLGQTLTALKMDMSLMERDLADEKKEIAREALMEGVHSSQQLIDRGIQTVRAIMSELRPELLDQLGLVEALEWEVGKFQQRSGILCGLSADVGDLQFDARRSIALFRLVQESLTNVARHAQAIGVDVVLRTEGDELILEIKDDGIGITLDAENKPRSFGLIGMRERAIFLGGTLEITGVKGKGTTIVVRMPIHEASREGGI